MPGTPRALITRDIVVIGASAGGVKALRSLFERIPLGFTGAIFVVLHRSAVLHRHPVLYRRPMFSDRLGHVLRGRSCHPIHEPDDGDAIEGGVIYVAPRDRHLLLEDGRMRLTRGPKEHFTRPAVDPLFRSAAAVYGRRVAGVLLTGCGYDGPAGLVAIKEAGGISLVQDPREAEYGMMPLQAIRKDCPDLVLPLDEIATTVTALMNGRAARRSGS